MKEQLSKAQKYFNTIKFCIKHRGWTYEKIAGITDKLTYTNDFDGNEKVVVSKLTTEGAEVIKIELIRNGKVRETSTIAVQAAG